MSLPTSKNPAEQATFFQFTIILLSAYVLVVAGIQTLFELSPEMDILLNAIDMVICLIFLGDFFYRLHKAESKRQFLKWGWIDFVSSIPMFDQLRWGRIVRVVRLFRILRGVRSTKVLLTFLFQHRVKSTFLVVVFTSLIVGFFSAIAMLNVETEPRSNIKTAEDAIWWAFSTVTTVGYGDKYPVTTEGRIVAVILMTAGVTLFGTFTALVASFFLGAEQKKEHQELQELIGEIKLLREKIEALERDRR